MVKFEDYRDKNVNVNTYKKKGGGEANKEKKSEGEKKETTFLQIFPITVLRNIKIRNS